MSGHSLGLAHSPVQESIMYPFYKVIRYFVLQLPYDFMSVCYLIGLGRISGWIFYIETILQYNLLYYTTKIPAF